MEGIQDSMFEEKPRNRHWVAIAVAAVVSLALHLFALKSFPPVPIGRPSAYNLLVRIPSVQLQKVLRDYKDSSLQRPARFRPENPESMADIAGARKALGEILEPVSPPETPDLGREPLAGEGTALVEPAPASERLKWEPRAELIQIEEALYADEISALPRRYVDRIPRSLQAPDITLPATVGVEPDIDRAGSSGTGFDLAAAGDFKDLAGPGGEGMGAVTAPPEAAAELEEQTQLLDEPVETVTALQPIERLLALEVSVFRPADEPDFMYYRIRIRRQGAEILPVLPRDLIFLQDCSESITQSKLNQFKTGLDDWMDTLGPDDRVNLMGFSDAPYLCFADLTAWSPEARQAAGEFVRRLASRGKTDVFAPLQKLLAIRKNPERTMMAVLLTDGRPTMGVVDSTDIIESFTRSNKASVSIFSVGAGDRVNRFLLDLLSYKNRGDSVVVPYREEIPAAMDDLAQQLSRPVLTALEYRFTDPQRFESYPEILTDLFLDRPLVIYGRGPAKAPAAAIQIVGRSMTNRHDIVYELKWNEAMPGAPEIRTQWAWHKIYYLIGEHLRTQKQAVLDELRGLATRFDLPVPYGGDIPLP